MRRAPILIVLCALVTAACGLGGGRQVATVNGEPIMLETVAELRPDPAVESELFRQDLFRVIATEALVQEMEERFDLEVSDEAVAEKLEALEAQIEQEQGSVEEFLESQDVTRTLLERVALEQAVREAIDQRLAEEQEAPTEIEIEAAYQGGLPGFTTVCARHILVETEQEAEQARERIEMGEDFGEVAQEVSLDTASAAEGGELACTTASVFDPMFADAVMTAELGELVGPVETQFGFHIIEVSSREQAPLEEVRDRLVGTLEQRQLQTAFQDFVEQTLEEADVEVEPRYGTWTTDPFPSVLAPEGAEETTTTSTTSP